MPIKILKGSPLVLGATIVEDGVNFALFVEKSTPLQLEIYDKTGSHKLHTFDIPNRTGQIRHACIQGLKPPFAYCYRLLDEPYAQFQLIDPYSKDLCTTRTWGDRTRPYQPLSLFAPPIPFDWEETNHPRIPKEKLILYEMHVRGLTMDAASGSAYPGKFLGVIEKIPYLKSLGVNAIELLPTFEFDENEYPPKGVPPKNLHQYWGYSSVSFFALMNRYACSEEPGAAAFEFKQMVKELHRNGIEVILDLVYNHTAEGNGVGPTYSYKALGKHVYYLIDSQGGLANYTGCGNTFNCNHPVAIQLILDSLRYLVTELHIDGFRFDLASIFYRGQNGEPLERPPLVSAIAKDPLLHSTKLIVEPWDAAGLFQVGKFYPESVRFSEWNSFFRDDMRRFIKGDKGHKGKFATRISGSEDLYAHRGRHPRNSLNFIACHDGFTLNDLVSYNEKHNEANGEENRDGSNSNDSWNCGQEGPSEDAQILHLREKQIKNFHLALMLSQGIPMIQMGDEYGHTRQGNNNAWCQDNPLSWFLWDKLKENEALFRFYNQTIHFRQSNPYLSHKAFLKDSDISWHGPTPFQPIWEGEEHFLAFTLIDPQGKSDLYAAFNAGPDPISIEIPQPKPSQKWHWLINTALRSPDDFKEPPQPIAPNPFHYQMEPFSSLLLISI